MHRAADRHDRRQHPLRAQQRFDQRHRQRHRSRGAGRIRQARRHGDDQRVRRRLAREGRAPRRRAREARAGESGVRAGDRKAGLQGEPTRSSRRPPAITPEYRAQVAADCIEPCKARTSSSPPASSPTAQSFTAIANSKGNFGYQKCDQRRLHLHRAHRRRPRLGLGRAQPRRRRASSTPRATSRRPSRRPKVRPTPRRSSPASTP